MRVNDHKIAPLDANIAWMLAEQGTTLTAICGIGNIGAATILAITGDVTVGSRSSRQRTLRYVIATSPSRV